MELTAFRAVVIGAIAILSVIGVALSRGPSGASCG